MNDQLDPTSYYELHGGVRKGDPRVNSEYFAESMYGPAGHCFACGFLGPPIGTFILGASDTPDVPFWQVDRDGDFGMVTSDLAERIGAAFPDLTLRLAGKKSAKARDVYVLIPEILPITIWEPEKLDKFEARILGFPTKYCEVCENSRQWIPGQSMHITPTRWPEPPQGPFICTKEQFRFRDMRIIERRNFYRGDLAQFLSEASPRPLEWCHVVTPAEILAGGPRSHSAG